MERLTNKREADAQREKYERRLANGYPRNIPEERFLRLAAYEDTGLTPEEINDLASVREISPEAEYAINKHADNIIERLDKLLHQTDDDIRLRELADADKDGRVVVRPYRLGAEVYVLLEDCTTFYPETNGWYVGKETIGAITPDGFYLGDPVDDCFTPDSEVGKSVFLT